jgi:iron(III) transport system ATP-binding protein
MGYCFRTFQFAGNIGFGVEARSAQRSKRVAVLMEMVALDPARLALAGRIVRRTAAARSFGPSAVSASIMLLDEPFSALDTGLRAATREAIGELLTHVGATTILVTRDQVEALSFADQIAVIRRGRLVQVGAGTELYLRPKDDLTACFLGDALLPTQLAGGVADCVLGRIAVDDVAYEGHARIMLRPEQVQIDAACSGNSDGARWQVEQVDFEGFSSLITIRAIGTMSLDGPRSLTVRGLSTRARARRKGQSHGNRACSSDAFLRIALSGRRSAGRFFHRLKGWRRERVTVVSPPRRLVAVTLERKLH